MPNELSLNEYRIFTDNPVKIENKVIMVNSVKKSEETPHTCKLIIHKMTSSRDDKIKVEFDIQMVFDPDGSRLEILLDANPWKSYEFVITMVQSSIKVIVNIQSRNAAIPVNINTAILFCTF